MLFFAVSFPLDGNPSEDYCFTLKNKAKKDSGQAGMTKRVTSFVKTIAKLQLIYSFNKLYLYIIPASYNTVTS